MATKWVERWRYEISDKPVMPGVWRKREGGFLVRGRATDPTGKKREVLKPLDVATADEARAWLLRALADIVNPPTAPPKTRFDAFAASLLERKVRDRSIRSAKTREKWGSILEHHLFPAFGSTPLEDLRRAQVVAWRDGLAERIGEGEGKYSPNTVNGWLAILRVVVGTFVHERELDRNPIAGVEDLDTSEWSTYTDEEPNALTVEEVRAFLATMRREYPQHYAMTALGFATGLRPSSLRPLRRCGPQADVRWEEGVLLVRRSHTKRDEVMERTKTGLRQRIALPDELVEILRWHEGQLEGAMAESNLLFPSVTGGFRSASCLDKPFAKVAKAAGIAKHITPRAMRRTFQDLARAAEVHDLVTRSISGHATETMQAHYSTVAVEEQRGALAKVVSLAAVREAHASAPVEGVKEGVKVASR